MSQSIEIPGMWHTDGRGLRVRSGKPLDYWRAREHRRMERLAAWMKKPVKS